MQNVWYFQFLWINQDFKNFRYQETVVCTHKLVFALVLISLQIKRVQKASFVPLRYFFFFKVANFFRQQKEWQNFTTECVVSKLERLNKVADVDVLAIIETHNEF
eukprot:TRINITY_DN57765_c0_g1_i1.p2 TRINITY_DN57765_c0_g1~~TRINITY_DN57765_c0_g1_i1.p2  ORF type:complete len:105 (+),score=6.33 TRINITY_DN57765_c0_g1_i1:31-345(+)